MHAKPLLLVAAMLMVRFGLAQNGPLPTLSLELNGETLDTHLPKPIGCEGLLQVVAKASPGYQTNPPARYQVAAVEVTLTDGDQPLVTLPAKNGMITLQKICGHSPKSQQLVIRVGKVMRVSSSGQLIAMEMEEQLFFVYLR